MSPRKSCQNVVTSRGFECLNTTGYKEVTAGVPVIAMDGEDFHPADQCCDKHQKVLDDRCGGTCVWGGVTLADFTA